MRERNVREHLHGAVISRGYSYDSRSQRYQYTITFINGYFVPSRYYEDGDEHNRFVFRISDPLPEDDVRTVIVPEQVWEQALFGSEYDGDFMTVRMVAKRREAWCA